MDKEQLKRLGENIKREREAKGISQTELANRCDFERGNMTRIEKGNTNPTFLTLLKLAKALDVSVLKFLDGF